MTVDAEPWWLSELRRLEPTLRSYFSRHSGAFDFEYGDDDLQQDVSVRLLAALRRNEGAYPDSWFLTDEPKANDRNAFRSLVWTIARARLYDRLRRRYVERRAIEAASLAREASESIEEGSDVRRAMLALAASLSELSTDEQMLLAEANEDVLTSTERVRRFRLKKRIAEIVRRELRGRKQSS